MFLNPTFKMTTSFANIATTTASKSKFIFNPNPNILGKISNHQEFGFYMKNNF